MVSERCLFVCWFNLVELSKNIFWIRQTELLQKKSSGFVTLNHLNHSPKFGNKRKICKTPRLEWPFSWKKTLVNSGFNDLIEYLPPNQNRWIVATINWWLTPCGLNRNSPAKNDTAGLWENIAEFMGPEMLVWIWWYGLHLPGYQLVTAGFMSTDFHDRQVWRICIWLLCSCNRLMEETLHKLPINWSTEHDMPMKFGVWILKGLRYRSQKKVTPC